MTRARDKRMGRVQQAVDASPVCQYTLQEEYEWFLKLGELPDDERLSYEVVMKAMRGGARPPAPESLPLGRRQRPRDIGAPSVRGFLFDEALNSFALVRQMARITIANEVSLGGDVESPGFGARHGIPTYGAQCFHCWNAELKLGNPPYEDQARRLFVRRDRVCARIAEQGQGWYTPFTAALSAFSHRGELPDDALILDAVLMFTEEALLVKHWRGVDVEKPMALLDEIARKDGDQREAALAELSRIGAAGELP